MNESLNLTLTSPVQTFTEPVSLAELKTHLGLPTVESPVDVARDAQLEALITAARQVAEGHNYQNRSLVAKQYDYTLDEWPLQIRLPVRPAASVDTFTYRSYDDITYSMTEGIDYIFDPYSSIIRPPDGGVWPSVSLWPLSAILIRFTTAPPAVSQHVKQGILMLAALWFEGRLPFESSQVLTHSSTGLPFHRYAGAVEALLKLGGDPRGTFA